MDVKICFSDSEIQVEDFDFYLSLLRKALNGYFHLTPFSKIHYVVYKGGCHEETPKETCNKGVCKQRRNKAVKNANKPS